MHGSTPLQHPHGAAHLLGGVDGDRRINSNAYGQSYMSPANLRVEDGSLKIRRFATTSGAGSRFVGGQLSSWNRLCFQGGYLEVRHRLPGAPGDSGLWPAVWTLGNLARDLYPSGMSGGFWPISYDACAWPTPGTCTAAARRSA